MKPQQFIVKLRVTCNHSEEAQALTKRLTGQELEPTSSQSIVPAVADHINPFNDGSIEVIDAVEVEPGTPASPRLVGVWVAAVTPQLELIKWGKDGDTVYPYPTRRAAVNQAQHLAGTPTHRDDRFFLLNVFDNGQIRTDELT